MWALVCLSIFPVCHADTPGKLFIRIVDAESDKTVPARILVTDTLGKSYIAEDALPVPSMCGDRVFFGDRPGGGGEPGDEIAASEDAVAEFGMQRQIKDTFSDALHFYSDGEFQLAVPAGEYNIEVFKGPEYVRTSKKVTLKAGEELQATIRKKRFANMPAEGWYSADDHIHIPRPDSSVNSLVLKMMQAEDINVANILSMGRADTNSVSAQYAFGADSEHREGNYIIISGQENNRTHLLGHTITLGAESSIYHPETYPIYRLAWEEAVRQGGINGYAHYAEARLGFEPGLPILLPHNLMHFIEVLQRNHGRYGAWYDTLNLGFRIAATAGTDYMCNNAFPGAERFYTRVEGAFTYDNWLKGVHDGKTFVTTGPLLEFHINGEEIGGEVVIPKPGEVALKGAVRFRMERRDWMAGMELVRNGEVVHRFARIDDSGAVNFDISFFVAESSWLAVRTYGRYANMFPKAAAYPTAHTSPIFVTVENKPPLEKSVRAQTTAKKWLAGLCELEYRLTPENIEYTAHSANVHARKDPLPVETLLANRDDLIGEILEAKAFFSTFFEAGSPAPCQ